MEKEGMLCTKEVLKNGDEDFFFFKIKWPRGGSTLCTAECLEPSELYSAHSQGLNSHFASNTPNKMMSLGNKSFCGYIWIF